MLTLLQSILSILVTAEFVLGNFANVFIALVNIIGWVKCQNISCTDQILTALAISRIGLLWSMYFYWYATVFHPAFQSLKVRAILDIFWAVSNHFSLWFAVGLSILYLLKIANFSCPFFLHLKWKSERVVVVILLGALVFLVCHLTVVNLDLKMVMDAYEGNITLVTDLRNIVRLSNVTVCTVVLFIPFTASLTALLLLVFSLWKHLKKMQLSGQGSQDASTKVHLKAMQTVVSFLLLFFIYSLARITAVWNSSTVQNMELRMFCRVLGLLYPSSHSFILIWGNKKLRQAILSFLWQLRCWLKVSGKLCVIWQKTTNGV